MTDTNNILNPQDDSLKNNELLKYLQEELNNEQQHEFEKNLLNSPFYSDAVEGLESLKNKNSIDFDIEQLQQSLKKQIQDHKKKKKKRKIKELPFIILITAIVLLLCVLAFIVVYFTQHTS